MATSPVPKKTKSQKEIIEVLQAEIQTLEKYNEALQKRVAELEWFQYQARIEDTLIPKFLKAIGALAFAVPKRTAVGKRAMRFARKLFEGEAQQALLLPPSLAPKNAPKAKKKKS